MKLVMTLLVRDEQDIVAANLDYHLARGVDLVIATDNRSTDRTASILEGYRAQGKLHYIFEPRDDYDQRAWVTSMARMAFTQYSADWVINNDADEFWWPFEGDLKQAFACLPPDVNIVEARRYNFVTTADSEQPFWNRMMYRETVSLNTRGRPLLPKAAHRGSADVKVAQGNHSVEGIDAPRVARGSVEILHFPVRSYRQIENKIVNGGAAYERNQNLPKTAGSTWRALYEEYVRHGHLRHHFEQISYDAERLDAALRSGTVVLDRRLADFLDAYYEGCSPRAMGDRN